MRAWVKSTRLAVASGVAWLTATACTQDFGSFESNSSTDGADADAGDLASPEAAPSQAEGDAQAASPDGGDASPADDAAADASVCLSSVSCVETATTCKTACAKTLEQCLTVCGAGNGRCRQRCNGDAQRCQSDCTSTCQTCAGTTCASTCSGN